MDGVLGSEHGSNPEAKMDFCSHERRGRKENMRREGTMIGRK